MAEKAPKYLTRPPVGGLRFAVRELSNASYRAEAVDYGNRNYVIATGKGGLKLSHRDHGETFHESIDAAETAAGGLHRRDYPLAVPSLRWEQHNWTSELPKGGTEKNSLRIAKVCDVPFLGSGHLINVAGSGSIDFVGARGGTPNLLAFLSDEVTQALATACGMADPYAKSYMNAHWITASEAQAKDFLRVLIKAANAGRKLYRAFPVQPRDLASIAGSRRQEYAWDAWDAQRTEAATAKASLKAWRRTRGEEVWHDFESHHDDRYDSLGEPAFYGPEVVAGLSSGTLRYRDLNFNEIGHAGIQKAASHAYELSWVVVGPKIRKRMGYEPYLLDKELHGRQEILTPYSLVEIVEYNDGDTPYVKSLGFFRALTSSERRQLQDDRPGRCLTGDELRRRKVKVKVFGNTWLSQVQKPQAAPAHAPSQKTLWP